MIHARDDYNRIQDPWARIPVTEPVFLLRAQDIHAAECVETWADLNDIAGGDTTMSDTARLQARLMREWHKHKLPDC